jgi:hypothetical protein
MGKMKKSAAIVILFVSIISFSNLFADETKGIHQLWPYNNKRFLTGYGVDSYFQYFPNNSLISQGIAAPTSDKNINLENYSQIVRESMIQFSLGTSYPEFFTLKTQPQIVLTPEKEKNYRKSALQITTINMTVWMFNKYIMAEDWADISMESIWRNLQSGFAWDVDTFRTNQLGHPYHGAIHYSVARANGLSFLESTLYSALGSITWELLFESIQPSANDVIMNTLGGITLGEVLYRTADLIIDESSSGLERALRETLAFFVNPAYGFRFFSGDSFKSGYPAQKRFYSLKFPFGARSSTTDGPIFLIAANLEYQDYLRTNLPKIEPYEWFSLHLRLGFQDYGLSDQEIFSTGILTGRKVNNGLAGLFGIFDYMNSQIYNKMSAIGVGPGLVTLSDFDADYYFSSSGVLTVILGGSSPSIDSSNGHFGQKTNDPYYFGPGMMGRVKFEFGKRGLGSIHTGYSQYWVHSIYTSANEYLGILSLNINYDISSKSEISLGYDYYLRHASLQNERFTGTTPSVRALYIFKF